MKISTEAKAHAQDLLDFIDASPSPWHAVQTIVQRLTAAGFVALQEAERWKLEAGKGYYVIRGGSSIMAFRIGSRPLADTGFRMIGAHTDSPGLRLKTHTAHAVGGMVRLGVEVYGGPILATFADRDLSLAGRVTVRTGSGFESRLVRFSDAMLRLPNLAIHMNRDVNENGLKLNKQNELPLLLTHSIEHVSAKDQFAEILAKKLDVEVKDILTHELNVYDTQPGSFWGAHHEFIADSQLDNLASCHNALTALLSQPHTEATAICAFFDHEEVGSESAAGAGGSFAADILDRIALSLGLDEEAQHCMSAKSFFVSADMAHAYQPNFPNAYEPQHHVLVNHGPVIKTNSNQRYSTNASSAAHFMTLCEKTGVPCQNYIHRTDLGCGSTIGPIIASRLGVSSVDVGSPMWAMHSLRESAGVLDVGYMIKVMQAVLSS